MSFDHRHSNLRRVVLAAVVLVAGAGSLSAADDAKPSDETHHPSAGAALADRESIIRDRVGRLEDRMFQLSQALRKTDPEKAQRLIDGLGKLRSERVRERVDRIVEKLQGEEFADAADAQREIASELQSLLKLLLEDSDNLEERKAELERLDAFGKKLEKIIGEQEKELSDAQSALSAEQRAAALAAAAKKLEDLIKQQKQVAESNTPAQAAPAQAKICIETDAVSKDVESIAEAANQSDTSDPPEVADQVKQAREALGQATEKMQSAEARLGEDDGPGAKAAQDSAAKDLERARKGLSEAARELREKQELQKQAESQKDTAAKTDQLQGEMKEGSKGGGEAGSSDEGKKSGGDQGEQKDGQPGSQGADEEAESTPGRESVEEAVPLQRDAAKDLKKDDPAEAAKKQQQALEKLKQAKEALEDRLEQLRREQQEELLAALESRFRAMLSRQLECNKATDRLADVGAENWKRSDQLELAELSQRQQWVGDQADEALFMLVEEGTTVILPKLVGQVRDDGRAAAERLAAADTGPTLRMMQADLEQVLRDIIDAVKKEQEELENTGGAGSTGGGNSPPLLPGSAELKLLRACQLRVNSATESLETARIAGGASAQSIDERLMRLADRQAEVAEMAKDMHEAVTKAQ